MNRRGRARRRAILELAPEERPIVDVGADHGHMAAALSAIATERQPHRVGRRDVRWVVADGLAPFREVPAAILAGMGARTIAAILKRGPRPGVAVVHAPDDPPLLRRLLAAEGWRIEEERLAPEARRFAEIMRIRPGRETATGLKLLFGPRLLEHGDPHLHAHLRQLAHHWARIAHATAGKAPEAHADASARLAFVQQQLARLARETD